MPPRSNAASSSLCSDRKDTWYFWQLSSLEWMVALMLVFGVAASVAQPILRSTRESLARSAKQLNQPPQNGANGKAKPRTGAAKSGQNTPRRGNGDAALADRPGR
jgi:hypothetical protein